MATTILSKKYECYNPFFCNGKEISFIEFTQDGHPIGCKNCGWFDSSNNRFISLTLPFEVKNKRVYTYKPEAFIIKANNDYKKGYKLVLPVELLPGFKIEKDFLKWETRREKYFCDKISFNLVGIRAEYVEDNIKGVTQRYTEEKEHTIKTEVNFKHVDTPEGEQYKRFSEVAKSVNVNLSGYQFEHLCKVFNISLK